jgi:beta-lactamase class A
MSNLLVLEKQFALFEKYSSGILGVSAIHIESGHEIQFNSAQWYPMCSTFKLPIAIYLLHKAENGHINLDEFYTIKDVDLRPGFAFTLNDFDCQQGFPISLRNLLLMMLRESCNTSTDILLNILGGPPAAMMYLRELGIFNMRIDRNCLEIIAATDGVKNLPPNNQCTLAQYKLLEKSISKEELEIAKEQFHNDPRDSTTPASMSLLLVKLFKQELLNSTNTTWLLNIMRRNKLYPHRLMGLLPHHTAVAHKTGTATGYTNDVGIITLPHDAGHIAVSVFIKQSSMDKTPNERALAEVGRTIYDFFLFNTN